MPSPSKTFPLILTFSELFQIGDSIVRVGGDTRILGEVSESGEWRCAAVSAGGVDEGGATLGDAHRAVRNEVRLVLEDCAHGVSSVEAFAEQVRRVFSSTHGDLEREWNEALSRVRAGKCTRDSGTEKLPVKLATDMREVSVGLVSEPAGVENLEKAA